MMQIFHSSAFCKSAKLRNVVRFSDTANAHQIAHIIAQCDWSGTSTQYFLQIKQLSKGKCPPSVTLNNISDNRANGLLSDYIRSTNELMDYQANGLGSGLGVRYRPIVPVSLIVQCIIKCDPSPTTFRDQCTARN